MFYSVIVIMFTRDFILMFLCSSLVAAAPPADRDFRDKFWDWYNKTITTGQSLYGSAVNSVQEYYEKAKANAADLTADGLAYFKEKAEAIKDSTLAQIKAANDAAKTQIKQLNESIGKTSQVIAYESEKIWAETQKTITQINEAAAKKWDEEVKKAQEYYGKKGEANEAP